MPVALALPFLLLFAALFLSVWIMEYRTTLVALVRALLNEIPLIGGILANLAEKVLVAAIRPVAALVQTVISPVVRFFDACYDVVVGLPHEVTLLARDTWATLDALYPAGIRVLIHAITNPIERTATDALALGRTLRADLTRDVQALRRGIDDMGASVLRRAERDFTIGIDRLRSDILDRAIPAVRDLIRGVEREAVQGIDAAERGIADVRGELGRLARSLDIPLSVLEALIAAVGVTAAIEALQTLATCRGKLRTLCTSDPRQWEQFILGLALLAAWPGLVPLTKETGDLLHGSLGLLQRAIVDGG